jgi:hypothetical protein
MKNINTRQWSTPVIIGSGLFVSISGVLMFAGVHNPVELAHEWLGLLFATGIVLHVLNHWSAFKKYFSQRVALSVVGAVVFLTSGFIAVSATQDGGNPMKNAVHRIEASPIVEVAPLLDEPVQSLVFRLQASGLKVDSSEKTIKEIARESGSDPHTVMRLLFSQHGT